MKGIPNLLLDPHPLRALALRVIRRFGLGSYEQRVKLGAVARPHYAYCVYHAARLARALGLPRMSVIEFGVAGGNGLVCLEHHAEQVSRLFPIEIEVYGFDSGKGLPKPADYRDTPYHWREGFYTMDLTALESRLRRARLVLGDVETTVRAFTAQYQPAPIGAIVFDLDFYSSTAAALRILDEPETYRLPRVFCYFDDIIGDETELYNDFSGERLAIREYNDTHDTRKLSFAYCMLSRTIVEPWCHQMFIHHDFGHSRYAQFISADNQQKHLQCE